MANGALESGLRSNEILIFSPGENRDGYKQVESFETGNTSEQPKGSFTMKPVDK